ncbi:hypothetical protein [Nocardia takedensis]|uniref:hypothetical protein n=1 Tax=Nocardia takedensis TaxID=259390 RepID=UPI0002DB09DF|nr:hypothetical protein [Nocardia takedensis]
MHDHPSNPSTPDTVPSPVCPDAPAEAVLRVQFCRGEDDLTAHPGGESEASEVRLWDGELCLAAIVRDRDGWRYGAADCGHRIADEQVHARYGDWREALHALTGIAVTTPQ